MSEIRGSRVLVTGGSRGIGPSIAEALARAGAHVAVCSRTSADLERIAVHLRSFGVESIAVPADLSEESEREHLVRTVTEQFGRIDILVNNAGLESEGAFVRLSWEEIRRMIELNLTAPISLTHLLLPQMLERRTGHIVNISSIGGKAGTPYDTVYCGTKAGLAEWTKGLRQELAGSGVKFSTVFPGYVRDAGMFARFGISPPWTIGSCSSEQVARAVVRSIREDRIETIVNSRPLRPAFALAALSPTAGDWLMRKLGVVEFQRRKVGQRG